MTCFLKKSKNHVFGQFLIIFGHFCPMRIFSKKSGSVTRNYIWAPINMLSLKKTNEPILRKLMDRWKDRWKDGWKDERTLFRPRPGVQQIKIKSEYCKKMKHLKAAFYLAGGRTNLGAT